MDLESRDYGLSSYPYTGPDGIRPLILNNVAGIRLIPPISIVEVTFGTWVFS